MMTRIEITNPDGTREYLVSIHGIALAAHAFDAFGGTDTACGETWPANSWCRAHDYDAACDVTHYMTLAAVADAIREVA